MSIRFKFRSSVNFDSVDIEGRPWISVRDLRSKILRQKNSNVFQGFDLVFSDAVTGHEYNDENFQIPSGSSVIIKRVPAESPSAMEPINSAQNFGMKDTKFAKPVGCLPVTVEMDEFDDFGVELCPIAKEILSDSDLAFYKCNSNEKADDSVSRLKSHKLEGSDLSEAIPVGVNQSGVGGTLYPKLESVMEERMKLARMRVSNCPSVQNIDLPSELRCFLCNTFFKEAVMIPCCQHSFCERCIRQVLLEKARCPKCFSTKSKVEDLLPNLSLRQAIEHFLESQMIMEGGADIDLQKYAPDGESGIQAKDISCAVTILQREQNMPLSPSATEKGSNQIMREFVCESLDRSNLPLGDKLGAIKTLKPAPLLHKLKQTDGEGFGYTQYRGFQSGAQHAEAGPDFQGESQPYDLPETRVHEEVDSTIKKMSVPWSNTGRNIYINGGDRSFMAAGRHRRGDRTCYICGSPDHLMRDCPAASSTHHMFPTGNGMFPGGLAGYTSPFWNGIPLPPIGPLANMYGNPGMMPFNAAMIPVSPFSVPPYLPSTYGSLPGPGGFLRMGLGSLLPPVGIAEEHPPRRSEFLEPQFCGQGRKHPRESDDEDDGYDERHRYHKPERLFEHKSHVEREKSGSYSDDCVPQESRRRSQHDEHFGHDNHKVDERHNKNSQLVAGRDHAERKPAHRERSNTFVEYMPGSSERGGEQRHRHSDHRSFKKHEMKAACHSDSSGSQHQTKQEKDVRRKKVECYVKVPHQKHHSHSKSGLEPSSSAEWKRRHKQTDSTHVSHYSRQSTNAISEDICSDRWEMVNGSDEDVGEGHCYHRRKRVH